MFKIVKRLEKLWWIVKKVESTPRSIFHIMQTQTSRYSRPIRLSDNLEFYPWWLYAYTEVISHVTRNFVNTFQDFRNKVILMMNDDVDPHHTIIWFNQASRFGPTRSFQISRNPVWLVGCVGERSEPTVEGWTVAKPETGAHRAKLDSHKFGIEAVDETGGLFGPCTRLKFSIRYILLQYGLLMFPDGTGVIQSYIAELWRKGKSCR